MVLCALTLAGISMQVLHDDRAETDRILLAVTKSGRQIEVAERPEKGALEVRTPYGIYHTPTDPVEVVMPSVIHRDWSQRKAEGLGPEALFEVRTLAESGRLTELVELADFSFQEYGSEWAEARQVAVSEALEDWGVKLDPVPPKVKWAQRTAWLWQEIQKEKGAVALLKAGRFLDELPQSTQRADPRALTIRQIQEGLENRSPVIQRVTALAAGKQRVDDYSLAPLIFRSSLENQSAMVREGAAEAAATIWPAFASNYWYEAITRGKEFQRIRGAFHLARFGGAEAIDYLAFTLAASGHKSGRKFKFAERAVQVVQSTRQPSFPLLAIGSSGGGACSPSTAIPITPDSEHFHHVSTIKVTKVQTAVTESLVKAIAQWAGEPYSERTAEDWLAWYEEHAAEGKQYDRPGKGAHSP